MCDSCIAPDDCQRNAAPVVPPRAAPKGRDVVRKLEALRPWFGALAESSRQIVELRVSGLGPAEIARLIGGTSTSMSTLISLARRKMESLRGHIDEPDDPDASSQVEPPRMIARRVLEGRSDPLAIYPDDVDRPVTRGDCNRSGGARPCPFISCSHHLFLDVNPVNGSIRFNFPGVEVWEMKKSCSLDEADRAGMTLEEVGEAMHVTRERVRQVEMRVLAQIRIDSGEELGIPPDPPERP